MIVAGAAVLHYVSLRGRPDADLASRAIYESVLEATAAGSRTPDLGGHATTAEFRARLDDLRVVAALVGAGT